MKRRRLSAKRLRSVLHYNPETGAFIWLIAGGQARVGAVAGRIHRLGYRNIQIDGREYGAGRLAWLYTYGRWPTPQIDHINRIHSDDRLNNLREATVAQNCTNRIHKSPSGKRGTFFRKDTQKWGAQIHVNMKRIQLGYFATQQDAYAAYCHAAEQYHGEFRTVR